MIKLVDYKTAEKIISGETEPSCTMYVYFYYDDKAYGDAMATRC